MLAMDSLPWDDVSRWERGLSISLLDEAYGDCPRGLISV
jgi:hypothetical protein